MSRELLSLEEKSSNIGVSGRVVGWNVIIYTLPRQWDLSLGSGILVFKFTSAFRRDREKGPLS